MLRPDAARAAALALSNAAATLSLFAHALAATACAAATDATTAAAPVAVSAAGRLLTHARLRWGHLLHAKRLAGRAARRGVLPLALHKTAA